jgi:hypothetical protein
MNMPVNHISIRSIGIKRLALFKYSKILTIAAYIINIGLNYKSELLCYRVRVRVRCTT